MVAARAGQQAPALRQLADRFPNFARMIGGLPASGYDFDLDALVETGLRALLDGFEALIERESGIRPPPRRPGREPARRGGGEPSASAGQPRTSIS
jgi:hypothetical protein